MYNKDIYPALQTFGIEHLRDEQERALTPILAGRDVLVRLRIGDGTYIFQAHGYRHTLATVFYDEGVPLQSVRDYLGHAYEEMTQQYIDYMPRWIDEASKAYFKETDNSLSVGLKERWKHGGSHRHKDTTMLPESN